MYEPHIAFTPPQNEDAVIWRYMELEKLLSLIDREALFFTKASKFEDPYEGSIPKFNEKTRREHYFSDERKNYESDEMYDWHIEGMSRALRFYDSQRDSVLINSWHLSEIESASMWSSYASSNKGIAIRSTYKRLCESFAKNTEDKILIGCVQYLDYDKEWMDELNLYNPFLTKRLSFESEKEIRAITHKMAHEQTPDYKLLENGKYVSVDLDRLIDCIYIDPKSSDPLIDATESVLRKYMIQKPVIKSELYTLK